MSLGAGDGDNDDEDSSDGESIEHHELARRESRCGRRDDYQDRVGAFDSLIDQALPEIHEDVTYREEQERIAEEIEHEQHESENKGGLLSMLGGAVQVGRHRQTRTWITNCRNYPSLFPVNGQRQITYKGGSVGRVRWVRIGKIPENAALRDLSCLQR